MHYHSSQSIQVRNFLRVNSPSVLSRFCYNYDFYVFHYTRGHLLKYEQLLWSNIIETLQIGGTMSLNVAWDLPIRVHIVIIIERIQYIPPKVHGIVRTQHLPKPSKLGQFHACPRMHAFSSPTPYWYPPSQKFFYMLPLLDSSHEISMISQWIV